MLVLNRKAPRRKQQGITLVLISLVMLFLLGMAGFSIDLNHQVLNKTRLQNAVDSAALSAAVVADETGDVSLAEAAARATLTSFIGESGNGELAISDESTTVTFSFNLESFSLADDFSPPVGDDDIYVRVLVQDIELQQFLSHIFGFGKKVSASAVAGRSAAINEVCNITPIAMCGDPLGSVDDAWGYQQDGVDVLNTAHNSPSQIHEVKIGSQSGTEMGPGNFHLLDFGQGVGGSGGASLVRDALSGAYNGCATLGETVLTKPGNSVGPVAQGLNTRLNQFQGPIQNDGTVPPDKYVKQPSTLAQEGESYAGNFYYSNYVQELASCQSSGGNCDQGSYLPDTGSSGRRTLRIPIVDCTDAGGKTTFDVLGFGCFFLLQAVQQSGQGSVFGQFLYECMINNGSTGLEPEDAGLYRIQLYKDPFSGAS